MFLPARMYKLKILILDQYADSTVRSLHEEGIVQIHDISERIQQDVEWAQILRPSKVTEYTGKISSLLMKTTGILDFLETVASEGAGLLETVKSFINPQISSKRVVEDLGAKSLLEKAETILDKVENKTKIIEEKLVEIDAEKNENISALDLPQKLINFDIDFDDIKKSKYITAIAGEISTKSFKNFQDEYAQITDEILIYTDYGESKTDLKVIIITLNEHAEELGRLLKQLDFERYEISPLSGRPKEIIDQSKARLEVLKKERKEVLNELKQVAQEWEEDLLVLKEELEIEKERNEIFASFGETDKTMMLEAWVPTKKADKALEIINESSEGYSVVDIEKPDGDQVPVKLDNPRFARPFQLFVDMYSPLNYNEIDPTVFVALVFPFFFGFCLTDAGYGIVISLVGAILYRGMGKVNETMRNFGIIMIVSGIWATILGLITNSFLGDFFPAFLGWELPTVIEIIDTFAYPQNILIMALLVGIVYTIVGLVLGAINNLRRGEIKEALGSQIVWLIMVLGVGLLAATYLAGFGSIYIGGALIAAAFIMLVVFNGLFGLMDISGFLGTILSYARLLALAMATGGIAITVNILAGLIGDLVPYLGIILAPIIFIFGHIVNGIFQTLGAFINSLRLHYVEFFTQFFIMGKSRFEAFQAKRKFTKS